MSSSSSEDDNTELLKEAIATDFINDDFYKQKKKQPVEEKPKLKSLRLQDDEDNQFNGPHVTAGFQNHVAKRLMNILDLTIKEKQIKHTHTIKDNVKKGGIKLFSDSKHKIRKVKTKNNNCDVKNGIVKKKQKIKSGKESESDTDERMDMAKSVAIDSDYILSKKETEHWSSFKKANIVHYKSNEIKQ